MAKGVWSSVAWAALAVVLTACGNSVGELMDRASDMRDRGRYQSAIADYREVLEREGENAEARFGIGASQLRLGEYERAATSLRRAREGGIAADRVEPLRARALLWAGERQRVHEETNPEALSDDGASAEVWALRGEAHRRSGSSDAARKAFDKALAKQDDNVTALVGLARLATAGEAYDKGESLARRALDANRDSPAAWLALAENASAADKRKEALDAYAQLLEQPITDIAQREQFLARGSYAQLLLADGQRQAASQQSQTLLEQAPEHPYSSYIAALIAFTGDDMAAAKEHLQVVLSAVPDNIQANYLMGTIRLQGEEFAQAVNNLRGVVSGSPRDVRARALLAAAYRGAGQPKQATRILADGIGYAANDPEALAYLSRAAGDDVDAVVSAFQERARNNPELDQAGLRLAQTLVGLGNSRPAMRLLEQQDLAEGQNDIMRRQFLALAALRADETEKAVAEAEALRNQNPDSAAAHNLAGGIYMALERFDEARAAFDRSRELAPDSAQASFNLGLLAIARDKLDQAAKHLEQGLEQNPDMLEARMALAQVAYRRGDRQRTKEVLEQAAAANSDAVQPHYALARLHRENGDMRAAISAGDAALERAPSNPDILALAGRLDLEAANHEAAVDHYRAAIERGSDDATTRFRLAQALDGAGETEAAVATLEELLQAYPDARQARLTLGLLYAQTGNTEAARSQAEELAAGDGGDGAAALLRGRALAADGKHGEAAEAYEQAVAKGRRDALGSLVSSRRQAGIEQPAAPMEAWLEENPEAAGVRLSLAQWYTQQRRFEEAVPNYEALASASDSPSAGLLNNLAYAYLEIGDPRALETARQALDKAPDRPAVVDTAGWAELRAGNTERAVELLAKASRNAPEDAAIRYHYGTALAKTGQHDNARRQLETALDAAGDANWREAAQRQLEALE